MPRFGAEVPEVFDGAGGGRWANRGTGADLPLAAASEPAQALPQLDRWQLHRGFKEEA